MKQFVQIFTGLMMILLILTYTSCKNNSGDLRQSKVDSLAYSLKNIEERLNIDLNDLKVEVSKMEKTHRLLKVQDTGISLEMGVMLDQYRNEIRIFKAVIEHQEDLNKELKELKEQLKNLLYSLKENKLDEASFVKVYEKERADVENLNELMNEIIFPYETVQSEHLRIAPKIEEYATKFATEK